MRAFLVLLLLFFIAPVFAPYDPHMTQPSAAFQPPSMTHPFGTDQLGRDVLSRALHGGRATLSMAVSATILAVFVGGGIGFILASGPKYARGVLRIVMSTNEAFRTIPVFVTAISFTSILGNNPTTLALSAAISYIPYIVFWTNQTILEAFKSAHIESARSLGATQHHILTQHVLPGILPQAATTTLLTFNTMLLTIGALTFVGFGLPPGTPEWGAMLREGRDAFRTAPWIATVPGIAITTLSFAALQYIRRSSGNFAS